MKDKKVIILIVLGIFAFFSIIHGIITPGGKRRVATEVTSGSAGIDIVRGSGSDTRRAVRTQYKSWKRSPFVPGARASTGLSVSGIIWSKTNPKAMVGDTLVKKGDTVGGNKVVDIKKDRVILNDGNKDFELKLEK